MNRLLLCMTSLLLPLMISSLDCTHGDARLASGINSLQGRVEVCFDGVWGTVCSNGWGNSEATVVCRQLGFSSSSKNQLLNTYSLLLLFNYFYH